VVLGLDRPFFGNSGSPLCSQGGGSDQSRYGQVSEDPECWRQVGF